MRKEIAQAFLDNPAGTIAQTKHLVLTPEEANGVMHADGKVMDAQSELHPAAVKRRTSSKAVRTQPGTRNAIGYIIEQHGDQVYYKGTKSKPAEESAELVRPAKPVEGFPALKEAQVPEQTVVSGGWEDAPVRTSR